MNADKRGFFINFIGAHLRSSAFNKSLFFVSFRALRGQSSK
jgi:hypothetical protein